MKVDRNINAVSVKELIEILQTLPEDAMVWGSLDRLPVAQPNDKEWFNWTPLGDIMLSEDKPFFWKMDDKTK